MLNLEDIRTYCNARKGVTENFPFDFSTLVLKVGSKIFLLTDIDADVLRLNLKCDPALALYLRSQYPQITPGYHMNKKHWNTVIVDGHIPDDEIYRLIDHSYELVFTGLKKSEREDIEGE